MLLFWQQRKCPKARQPPEVWRVYNKLFLPKWDLDFIKLVLWRKLPVGVRQERMGGKMCPLDGQVEDHQHSTDVSDTRLGRAMGSDSDEFSTDVSDSRKRRRREGGSGKEART